MLYHDVNMTYYTDLNTVQAAPLRGRGSCAMYSLLLLFRHYIAANESLYNSKRGCSLLPHDNIPPIGYIFPFPSWPLLGCRLVNGLGHGQTFTGKLLNPFHTLLYNISRMQLGPWLFFQFLECLN